MSQNGTLRFHIIRALVIGQLWNKSKNVSILQARISLSLVWKGRSNSVERETLCFEEEYICKIVLCTIVRKKMHNFEYIGSIYTRTINLASLLHYSNVIIYVLSIKKIDITRNDRGSISFIVFCLSFEIES